MASFPGYLQDHSDSEDENLDYVEFDVNSEAACESEDENIFFVESDSDDDQLEDTDDISSDDDDDGDDDDDDDNNGNTDEGEDDRYRSNRYQPSFEPRHVFQKTMMEWWERIIAAHGVLGLQYLVVCRDRDIECDVELVCTISRIDDPSECLGNIRYYAARGQDQELQSALEFVIRFPALSLEKMGASMKFHVVSGNRIWGFTTSVLAELSCHQNIFAQADLELTRYQNEPFGQDNPNGGPAFAEATYSLPSGDERLVLGSRGDHDVNMQALPFYKRPPEKLACTLLRIIRPTEGYGFEAVASNQSLVQRAGINLPVGDIAALLRRGQPFDREVLKLFRACLVTCEVARHFRINPSCTVDNHVLLERHRLLLVNDECFSPIRITSRLTGVGWELVRFGAPRGRIIGPSWEEHVLASKPALLLSRTMANFLEKQRLLDRGYQIRLAPLAKHIAIPPFLLQLEVEVQVQKDHSVAITSLGVEISRYAAMFQTTSGPGCFNRGRVTPECECDAVQRAATDQIEYQAQNADTCPHLRFLSTVSDAAHNTDFSFLVRLKKIHSTSSRCPPALHAIVMKLEDPWTICSAIL